MLRGRAFTMLSHTFAGVPALVCFLLFALHARNAARLAHAARGREQRVRHADPFVARQVVVRDPRRRAHGARDTVLA